MELTTSSFQLQPIWQYQPLLRTPHLVLHPKKRNVDSDSDSESSDDDSFNVSTTQNSFKKVEPTPSKKLITDTEEASDDDKPNEIKSLKIVVYNYKKWE